MKPLTVGHEMFGVMCDRLVAHNFPEDIEGKQFARVCRPGPDGRYEALPPVPKATATSTALENQRLALARLEALVARRSDLVTSFNALFPDEDEGFLTGLKKALAEMAPLYDRELPAIAASMDSILSNILASDEAVQALTRIANREGYRPMQASVGALAAMASQPTFGEMTAGVASILEEGTTNDVLLNQLLIGLHASIKKSGDKSTAGLGETVGKIVLFEDEALYAPGPETFVVKRDKCGFAAFAPQSSYAREAAGECAKTDKFGRMLDAANRPVLLPTPFQVMGRKESIDIDRDEFGRVIDREQGAPVLNNQAPTLYQYTNVSKTALASLLGDSRGLFHPDRPALNDVLTDLGPMLGDKSAKIEQLNGYTRRTDTFGAENAPVMDLTLASAPLVRALAKDHFQALDALANALEKNPRTSQRLAAALKNAKDLANVDTFAKYEPTSTFWDEVLDVLAEIADTPIPNGEPGLLEELLDAMADPQVQGLARAQSDAFKYRDFYSNHPTDVNLPAINLSFSMTSPTAHAPAIPVDRGVADGGLNASNFQRLIKMIHEASGVKFCNRQNGNLPGLDLFQKGKCELFQVDNMAAFFMQTIVTNGNAGDPLVARGKGVFPIKDGAVQALLAMNDLLRGSAVATFSQFMVDESGLQGLGIVPTPQALGRLLYVQRKANNSPSEDKLLDFMEQMADAAPSAVCKLDPGVTGPQCPAACLRDPQDASCAQCVHQPHYGIRDCDPGQTLAERNPGAIYILEQNNMYAALRPLLRPFVKYDRERLFLKLISAMHRHWPSSADATCEATGAPELNGAYCAKTGLVRYEPLLAQIFSEKADLVPAIRQAIIDLQPEGGAAKLAPLVRAFFSRNQNTTLKDRIGLVTTKRNQGQDNAYTTPATLLIKALDEIDARRKADATAFKRWKEARSKLVDELFAFEAQDGDISQARLKNQAMTRVLPKVLRVTAEQLRAKQAKPGFEAWLKDGFVNDTKDTLASPSLYAGVELLKALRADPSVERNLLATVYGALDPDEEERFINIAAGLVDMLQGLQDSGSLDVLVPLLAPAFEPAGETKVIGTAIVPGQGGMIKSTMSMLAKVAKIDPDRRISAVLANLVAPFPGTVSTPLESITLTIGEVGRVDATKKGEPYTDADTRRVLEGLREFFADEQTGFKRLISIIQRRTLRNLESRR